VRVASMYLFFWYSSIRTGKLVGHTDNIRAILLSEDAKYVRPSVSFLAHAHSI
jgi:hypothetical protein